MQVGSGSGLFGLSGSGSGEDPALMQCRDEFFANITGFCRSADHLSTSNITDLPTWTIQVDVQKYAPYVALIEALFFIVAFFWNLFILVSFALRRKLLKEPAGMYLFNLALTDFLLAIFIVFQCFLTETSGAFIVGSTDVIRCGICEFLGFMLMFLMTSTLHTLAMLSFDRFFLLIKPLSYRQYFNWRRSLVIVVIIWIFSFAMAIPPIFGFGEYSFSTPIANCHPQWIGQSYRGVSNFDYIIFLAGEALLPIAFLTFTNMWTYKIITSVLRSKLKRQRSFSMGTGQSKTPELRSKHNQQQLQLVKVFGALFVAHIMCWTPVMIMVVVGIVVGPCNLPPEVLLASWILYLTNPVIHPVLETFFIKDLRSRMYRAQKSVRNSLKRVSSMGSSFRRSWSQRSSRRSKGSGSRHSKATVSCKNSLALDGGGLSPVSSDTPSLPECDTVPVSFRDHGGSRATDNNVKFTVLEGREGGTSVMPRIPEPIIEEVEESQNEEEGEGSGSVDRSQAFFTPPLLRSVEGAEERLAKVKVRAFASQDGDNFLKIPVANGTLNASRISITTL